VGRRSTAVAVAGWCRKRWSSWNWRSASSSEKVKGCQFKVQHKKQIINEYLNIKPEKKRVMVSYGQEVFRSRSKAIKLTK
jgi:hypothetical protein